MNYLVAFVLKNAETEETKDEYAVFLEEEFPNAKQAATDFYNSLKEKEQVNGEFVYTANLCQILQSTDY